MAALACKRFWCFLASCIQVWFQNLRCQQEKRWSHCLNPSFISILWIMITTMCYSIFCNLQLTFTNICALFVCVCYPCGAHIYGSWYVGGSAAGVGAPALSAPLPSCLSTLKPLNWADRGNAAPGGPRTESGTLTHRQSAWGGDLWTESPYKSGNTSACMWVPAQRVCEEVHRK